jgi:antitoxin component of RelBE/YafQ-DinJ toxin-antitoxin module
MSELSHITVKLDKKLKELFLQICEAEGVDISQGVRELLTEAIARGYIVKERKDRLQKIKEGVNA